MFNLKIILFLLLNTITYANISSIDDKTNFYDLLPSSQIYIDKTKVLTIDDIKKKNILFKDNNKELLGFGYSPDFSVWIKFTLKNNIDKTIYKILEYDNSLTTNIEFFDISSNTKTKEGLFHINKNRKTLTPIFRIQLQPNESRTYYIKASSHITTLIIKLNLWDIDSFYAKEIKYQLILALFFGAMFILAIYNLFIYFFTKDISYMFYVLYILTILLHQTMYLGIAHVYFIKDDWIKYAIEYASIFVTLPTLALALFSKFFINTKQYYRLNKILNIFFILLILFSVTFLITDQFNQIRSLVPFSLLLFLMIITIYATIKRNRQAYFILFGWIIFLIMGGLMALSSMGILDFKNHIPYVIEVSLVLEAIIFSIALADRIKQLQKEKNDANSKLLAQKQNETRKLATKVDEKTKDLKTALDEKNLLLKELNHRVKNNMQTIVSLIRLQSDEIEDDKIQDMFITIQNRINAMSHLHELLYKQDNISHVNAYEYFDILIEELKDSYESDINITFDIKTELKMEQAIYCGLILNELISNSLKHAFPKQSGNIAVKLSKVSNIFCLNISDDGIGYNNDIPSNSLGLILVNTLAKNQLRGDININSTNGVDVEIKWSNND